MPRSWSTGSARACWCRSSIRKGPRPRWPGDEDDHANDPPRIRRLAIVREAPLECGALETVSKSVKAGPHPALRATLSRKRERDLEILLPACGEKVPRSGG